MTEYRIEEVTRGDMEYASDDYDFKRVIKGLLFGHLNYVAASTNLSDVTERHYLEDDWHNFQCGEAPDLVKCHEDSPYFTQHALVDDSMWEVMDGGRIKTLRNQVVLCLHGDEDESVVYMENHLIGECPHYMYYKKTVKDIILKCNVTMYVRCKADDSGDNLRHAMQEGIRRGFDRDRVDDEIRDVFEYDYNGELEDLEIRIHNETFTPVRRMP